MSKRGKHKNSYDKKIKQEQKAAALKENAEEIKETVDSSDQENAEEQKVNVSEEIMENSETSTEEAKKPEELKKTDETKKPEELKKTDETKKSEEPKKTDETKKSEEPKKTEETKKSEEPKKTDETKKSEEPKKTEETKKSEEPKKTEETKKPEESKKTEETKNTEVKKEEKSFNKDSNSDKEQNKTKKFKNRIPFLDKHLEVNWISQDAKNRPVKKQVETNKVNLILEILVVLIVALVLLGVFGIVRFVILENSIQEMNQQMVELISEQESMIAITEREKEELKDKISILTSQVAAQMVQNEEEALKHIPTALPVTGKVVIISEPGDIVPNEDEPTVTPDPSETQIVILGVNEDSKILASASGTVKDIRQDEKFGFCIEIDHGNDYVSLYYFNSEPKVKAGDEVLRGQLLFEVNANNGQMGYQVLLDGEYLNPVDLMEIKG